VLIPVQIYRRRLHGLNTLEHQPAKVAAMEGNWETRGNKPLVLFAMARRGERAQPTSRSAMPERRQPHPEARRRGCRAGPQRLHVGEHPPVAPVFFAFRTMVGVGMLMLLVSWAPPGRAVAAQVIRIPGSPGRWSA
jgi:cytochrome d ubiquinol oxidase subunit I